MTEKNNMSTMNSSAPTKESIKRFEKILNTSKSQPAKTRLLEHFAVGNISFSPSKFIIMCPSYDFRSPDGGDSEEKKKEIYNKRDEMRNKISSDLRTVGFTYFSEIGCYVKIRPGK